MSDAVASAVRGGSWLLEDLPAGDSFTPERMTEEQRLIDQTTREFVKAEVLERNDELEAKDWDLARRLLQRCGELGILGTDVPEQYGGFPLDTVTTAVIAGRFGEAGSFSTTFGAQTGLAILPILAFGTEAQKQRYLPKLVSGDCVGAYCLSEAGSGSDALGAKTRADRQPDGSFRLNGEKMWISNGGFADVYIVFAKVGGEQFTAFIVERAFEGVSTGAEEHKMGLNGSSTTPVIFQDAHVPAENLLGEIGKGHKVAFNVLNFGRFKLGASTVGSASGAIGEAARYAAQRRQFGQPIAGFGAIRHKLGEMTIRTYAIESMVFRTAGLIDADMEGHEGGHEAALLAALEEHAIESSILKVAGSEILDYVLDENVQIHGGNGYVRDYPAERHYRDARVNRIFEGTNEINRLLIPGMLVRRALKGHLPLISAARKLQDEILSPAPPAAPDDSYLAPQIAAVRMFKKAGLAVLGLAMQTYGEKLTDQQEVLSLEADILIDTYAAESMVHRALGAGESGAGALQADATRAFVSDAAVRIETAARSAIAAMAEGDMLRTHLAALRRLLKVSPVNTVAIRRRLADEAVARGGYIF
ncbi:MAG: acyl-CoA dehydrogenase family protein [Acidobacteria bacterium]|nr:acyl-CoA dehydrogenase family protein [Acidobacteriota bacterium]